jgi:NAD(P)H-nitrite reductase large subunit
MMNPDATAGRAEGRSRVEPRRMNRCECAELSFEEIVRRIRGEGLSLEQVAAATGCGGTCTACLPDLCHYLATR